jgi:hypothetical protein
VLHTNARGEPDSSGASYFIGQLYEPLRTIGKKSGSLQGYFTSAERAFALLDQSPDVIQRPDARSLGRATGEVTFKHVWFSYQQGNPILCDVSNEISAAMGLTGLDSFDDVVAGNARNYRRYRGELDGLPGVHALRFDEREMSNFQYVVIEVDEGVTRITRDELLEVLRAENVLARRYFYPGCHRMAPYSYGTAESGSSLPVTEALARRVLVLPTGMAVTPDDVSVICEGIRVAVENGAALHTHLAGREMSRSVALGGLQ